MHALSILLNPSILAVLTLFLSVVWMLRDQTDKTRAMLVIAIGLNFFFATLLVYFMKRESAAFPWKFDPILFRIDSALGVSAASIARPLLKHFGDPLIIIYKLMVPMMIFWIPVTRYRNPSGSVVLAYVAELIAAPILYAILPACGPIYAFGANWLNPPVVDASVIRLSQMPNAFPSLHMATAFVLVLFAPGKFWKGIALIFLTGTALATIATGEHYLIDLVPGLAFGAFAAGVGYRRRREAIFSLSVVLLWALSVRFGYRFLLAFPGVTLVLVLLTLALAIFAVGRYWGMQRSAAVEPPGTAAG